MTAAAAAPWPVVPRLAATTLVVRDSAAGLEVLMLRRSLQASFMPGSYVFPGGAVDAADAAVDTLACCDEDAAAAAARLAGWPLASAVAALRECFEECGLWLGLREPVDPARLEAARRELHAGASFAALARGLGLPLATRALRPFSHWVTPIDLPKRFDTRFFVALAPDGQRPAVDAAETTTLAWVRPAEAIAGAAAGRFPLEFVTEWHLRALARHQRAAALIEQAAVAPIKPVHPRVALDAAGRRRVLRPDDHGYAEVQRLDPRGSASAIGAIVPGRAVTLGPSLRRLTAPNPGVMTGPGTNSYLLGRDGGPYAVIDPGPPSPEHVDALLEATGGRVEAILVTHTHRDHSPAAALLAARTGARCIGLPAPPGDTQDPTFAPDHRPADGESLAVAGIALRAIRTPGHASNHVCWWWDDERMLFTGDHLMQGSTVVINPPDGDMAAYVASLRRLPALLPALQWLAPGHGFLIDRPVEAIERLVAHRLAREAKVLAALHRLDGEASAEALLRAVYDDVPTALHPVAARSLLAHLLKLRDEGRVAALDDGLWREAAS